MTLEEARANIGKTVRFDLGDEPMTGVVEKVVGECVIVGWPGLISHITAPMGCGSLTLAEASR